MKPWKSVWIITTKMTGYQGSWNIWYINRLKQTVWNFRSCKLPEVQEKIKDVCFGILLTPGLTFLVGLQSPLYSYWLEREVCVILDHVLHFCDLLSRWNCKRHEFRLPFQPFTQANKARDTGGVGPTILFCISNMTSKVQVGFSQSLSIYDWFYGILSTRSKTLIYLRWTLSLFHWRLLMSMQYLFLFQCKKLKWQFGCGYIFSTCEKNQCFKNFCCGFLLKNMTIQRSIL